MKRWWKRVTATPVYDGCACVDCVEAERARVGPHTCRFSSGEPYPEHCAICHLAINDPARHRFLRRMDVG